MLATLVVLSAVGGLVWSVVKTSYDSAELEATWTAYEEPFGHVIVGRVTDPAGRPVAGQSVEEADDSGTRSMPTDADGRFTFVTGGEDLNRLTVVGVDTIPMSSWNQPGHRGLRVEIRLKRPASP